MTTLPRLNNLRVPDNCLHQGLECRSLRHQAHRMPLCINRLARAILRIPKLTHIIPDEPIRNQVSHLKFYLGRVYFNHDSSSAMVNAGEYAPPPAHTPHSTEIWGTDASD